MHLLNPFIEKNLSKVLAEIQSYKDASFLGPKWPIFHEQELFQKTIV